MFDFIYVWIGKLISLFNGWTGNYILALLIFAVFAKVIFIPLDIKQQKNSIKQAQLRPKELAVRNKYKGRTDRATQLKLQEEIQSLYQREGYSPFSGCLPMFIQFPIIIILYGVIRSPISYISGVDKDVVEAMATVLNEIKNVTTFTSADQISMITAIQDLAGDSLQTFINAVKAVDGTFAFDSFMSSLPDFTLFGLNFGYSPAQYRTAVAGNNFFNIMLIVPALNFGMQYLSTKIMKKFQPQPIGEDPSQQTSMKIMELTLPLMTVYFAYIMSGAIGIYWVFQNILSLFERFVIAKLMPLPKYTEEEIKAMQKAMKKDQSSQNTSRPERREGEKPRSLHRIDEDDDDEPAPAPKKQEQKAEPQEVQNEETEPTEQQKKDAAIADRMIGEAPALKDESDKYNRKKK